ncbi:MAG TPA: hybrid sensor histidine kinase/response regulator [Vicinamibacterales bacterium]|nr:hybrid sensor histidine kinase/response regulator [Vicinamibacterales bacterium]
MKLSSFLPRSISLTAQLLLTFAVLVAVTAILLGVFAYTDSIDKLIDAARHDARVTATTRDQLLTLLLESRQRRAAGFLERAESICGEPAGRRGYGWDEDCVQAMLTEFLTTERATGAALTFRDRTVGVAGGPVGETAGSDGWTVAAKGRLVDYIMAATRGDARLVLRFDSTDVVSLFSDSTGLATPVDEVILIDAGGRPLTPLQTTKVITLTSEADQCRRSDTRQSVMTSYAGDPVVPAFRRARALPGTCIVVLLSEAAARAPARSLRYDLAGQGLTFIVIGILLSLFAAQFVAAPVTRLAQTARALQAGDFGKPVPIAGPSEVRDLGRAVAGMAKDIAELVTREKAARREAEAANRSKDQFLAMLSHELRTPLTAIRGWAHTLKTGRMDPERVQRAAAAIERGAEAQRRLIEDLLDVTGIAAGRIRMERVPTRLAAVVEAAVDAVGPRADEKDVHIGVDMDDARLTVHADPQRIQQVIWNLLWNAVKFTPSGGRVTVRVRNVGGLVEVTVTDNGIGIDAEFLPHVFGWFRRADRDARTANQGLGLGLALVRQLVELHGGSVRAESGGRNAGATFVVTLPLHEEALTADPDRSGQGGSADSLASIRVLVVDDDPGSREAVRVLLEQAGADVETAASADEARRCLRSAAADVLISDIAMDEENGYALMQSLRTDGFTQPAIALTAYARREDAEKAQAAGFDVHLPKPVDPEVLISVLVALCKRESSGSLPPIL